MPTPEGKKINNPTSRKLPPVNHEPEPNSPTAGFVPSKGVSTKLKTFVIGMTFVTVMAFGLLIALFIKKAFVKDGSQEWGPQLVTIAEQLKAQGLKPQAIEHYQEYLDTQKVDLKTRSRISFNIATLYVELGQCDEAVVWFLHANTAEPEEQRVQQSNTQIQQCRDRSKTSR